MKEKNRAERCIAQGALTNSKHWRSHIEGVYPTHVSGSTGPYLIDMNGKKYLDFICGLGTNLLGYGHPLIENEVEIYRHQGKSPSLPHVLEIEVAEQLKQCFPWVERWKFLKSGSEATSAAVRIARAYTSKDLIYSDGYHGWHDGFVSLTPPAHGVAGVHSICKTDSFNLDSQLHEFHTIAGVIVEPVITDNNNARIEELKTLRKNCTKSKSLLIFDEVITGLRYKQFSVSRSHNIEPDLIVIGKAMANGYALAAVGGKAEVMDCDYFVSSTYAGEISSLAACKAVLKTLRENPNYSIKHLWEAGESFLSGFNEAAEELGFRIEGYPTRGIFVGDEVHIALFMQEACKAGMLFGKSWFISLSHIKHLKSSLDACKSIMMKIKSQNVKLEGKMPRSPFALKVRT